MLLSFFSFFPRLLLLIITRYLLQPVLLHIRSHISHWTPFSCIQSQEFTKHLHGFWSEPFPQRRDVLLSVRSLFHSPPVCKLLVEVIRVHTAFPGEVACEDAEDNYAKCPGVQTWLHTQGWSSHLFLALGQSYRAKFRGHVGKDSCDKTYQGSSLLGKAKVRQLHLAAEIVQQKNIFRLHITVDQAMAVDELQSTGDLKDTAFYWGFWDTNLEQMKLEMGLWHWYRSWIQSILIYF